MISAGVFEVFSPFGREHCSSQVGVPPCGSHHTFGSHLPSCSLRSDAGEDILDAIREFSLADKDEQNEEKHRVKEDWILRECIDAEGSYCEDELYFQESVAVWSQGGNAGCHRVLFSMSMDSPLEQVLWCNFTSSFDPIDTDCSQLDSETVMPSVCLVTTNPYTLHVFSNKGEEFIVPLPFPVAKVWPIKYGLLLERKAITSSTSISLNSVPHQDNLPTLFSLLHPLNDITPVTRRSGSGKISYVANSCQRVAFSCETRSVIVTYDMQLGVHTIWKVRRAKREEGWKCLQTFDSSFVSVHQPLIDNISQHQTVASPTISVAAAVTSQSIHTLSSPSQDVSSLFRFLMSRSSSPLPSSRTQSPQVATSHHATNISSSQSPVVSGLLSSHPHLFSTPSPTSRISGNLSRTPLSSNVSKSFDQYSGSIEPLFPDLCLEPIWVEPRHSFTREGSASGQASKVFFTCDAVGQQFVCLLVPASCHVRLVKIDESNDRTQLIFGTLTVIEAKDAIPLSNCSLFLILDLGGNLVVYTGTTKICKVHVPVGAHPLGSLLANSSHVPPSSSRRNSMISTARLSGGLDSHFDDALRALSPVLSEATDKHLGNIQEEFFKEDLLSVLPNMKSLRDAIKNRFTVELANGLLYRLTVPTMSSSILVDKVLEAFHLVLPRDVCLQTFSKWYATRWAPGSTKMTALEDWVSFATFLFFSMGYDLDSLVGLGTFDLRSSVAMEAAPAKKLKVSESGSEEDWHYLKSSSCYKLHCEYSGIQDVQTNEILSVCNMNTKSLLFPHIPALLYTIHLVYEELKLAVAYWPLLSHLAKFLYILAKDLQITSFIDSYWRDFPQVCREIPDVVHISKDSLSDLVYPTYLTAEVPSVHEWLEECLSGRKCLPFPYIPGVCRSTKAVVWLYHTLCCTDVRLRVSPGSCLRSVVATGNRFISTKETLLEVSGSAATSSEATILTMLQLGLTSSDLDALPVGIALPLRIAIHKCRKNPPSDWPIDAYVFIDREDLAAQIDVKRVTVPHSSQSSTHKVPAVSESKKPSVVRDDDNDGMEGIKTSEMQLLFSKDLRFSEVRRLLQSSKPVRISVFQRPEVGFLYLLVILRDHEYIEEQEKSLYAICIRTMALPVGRGMFSLRSLVPIVTETLPIPKLCLNGRAPPRNTVVDLSHIDVPSNMNVWPLFHNGVASGLRVAPTSTGIDSTWIVYNKPKNSSDLPIEHAGFLMALGLNGHLQNLDIVDMYDYVAKGHEMTNVGLLLGIAASKIGTKDISATKLLSIHIEALLPPTSTELDIPHVIQVAAVLGIGLVYQGTAHRHISEVLLSEIGRPPGPEMENSADRQSYSLAAGLALGFVTLGKGSDIAGLSDLGMADCLYQFMVGGPKRSMTGSMRDKYKNSSYQIKEGDQINVDVTSPAATLALGLMFFSTNNRAIAEWMTAPDTLYLLDFVRPDFLLLRTLSKGLIMWDEILPSSSWVLSHLPDIIVNCLSRKDGSSADMDVEINFETLSQAYCNIVAGACMAMGLRFAGSANQEAYATLLDFARTMIGFTNKYILECAGRSTVETCLNVILLSLSVVMAGTGDLEILRMCRHLHHRIGHPHSHVHYGSHMAVHMAIGLLFFGGGRYTLSTDCVSVAALVCALFPKFPMHSNDNRYHLQAFRHLYVLAARPRLIIPIDIDSGRPCFTHLSVTFKETEWYKETSIQLKVPCLLPHPDLLSEVRVDDPRYWSVIFSSGKNWNTLISLLNKDGYLYVKQKMGCLSYVEDPEGFRSFLARALVQRRDITWAAKPEAVPALTSDPVINNIVSSFLKPCNNNLNLKNESREMRLMTWLVHSCVSKEKVELLSTFVSLMQVGISASPSSLEMWQVRLALRFSRTTTTDTPGMLRTRCDLWSGTPVLDGEFLSALDSLLGNAYERWSAEPPGPLVEYLNGRPLSSLPPSLAQYVVRCGILPPHRLAQVCPGGLSNVSSLPVFAFKLKQAHVPFDTILRIYKHVVSDRS